VSCKVKLELSVYQAAAIRESLFTDTKIYTYDPTCTPERVTQIREVITELDSKIEEVLENHKDDHTD
tara:strand:- start:105 stop:305 length:201 start_codon:yes stop_codon:yes gene_type:complete